MTAPEPRELDEDALATRLANADEAWQQFVGDPIGTTDYWRYIARQVLTSTTVKEKW